MHRHRHPPRDGVGIDGSAASILQSAITLNGRNGVIVSNAGSARIGIDNTGQLPATRTTIAESASSGLHVVQGSNAIVGGSDILDNGTAPAGTRNGVHVYQANVDLVGSNTISGNSDNGVNVIGGRALIGNNISGVPGGIVNTIEDNGASGVAGFLNASVDIRGALINDNTGHGVVLDLQSTGRITGAGIKGNAGNGITLQNGSGLLLGGLGFADPAVAGNGGGVVCLGPGTETSVAGALAPGSQSISCTGFQSRTPITAAGAPAAVTRRTPAGRRARLRGVRRPPRAAVGRFQRRLLAWYARHGRDLPWRRTRAPYRILVSEIMLQQTQVERVLPKYRQFLRRYPTLARLAAAPVDDVRRLWYPLGYNVRPLRLHAIARETIARYRGRLPDTAEALRALPGIGRYTAGAILSFAHGRDVAVLDTNVRRVLCRVFLGPRRTARVRGDAALWDLAEALVPAGRGYDFNQALMDFGATWCTPRRPRCGGCPMRGFCASQAAVAGGGDGRARG